ncbi:MAG: type IV secretion system protein, partial [Streptosporangiaceae bacterium]
MTAGEHGSATRRRRPLGRRARALLFAVFLAALVAIPAIPASASPLNPFDGLCSGSTPSPADAGSGVDGLVRPPGHNPLRTTYDNYGTAGLHWYSADLGCGDLFARAGNAVADTLFTFVRALDRVTITTYQAAYSSNVLDDLSNQVAKVIDALSHTLYLPYLTPFVIIGAIWLAWKGLVRGRATASVEATVWMVIAITAALWLINRPHQWMSAGTTVVNSVSQATMRSIIGLNQPDRGQCFAGAARAAEARQRGVAVDCAANTLWTALAYEPWQAGEFGNNPGLTARKSMPLLNAQTITRKEMGQGNVSGQVQRKQQKWERIKNDIKNNHADVYPLFQGKRWKERFGIAFGALLAALFCGLLILIASAAVLVFKIAFLLLLMAGPLFLLAGIHPGVGRLMAMHWFETLVGMLIKQILVSVALSFIMLGYMVILAPDAPFPWGVQIMLVALLAIAALILWPAFRRIVLMRAVAAEGLPEEGPRPGLRRRRTAPGPQEETASAGRAAGAAAMTYPGRRTGAVTRA